MNLPPHVRHHKLPASHTHLRLWKQSSSYAQSSRIRAKLYPLKRSVHTKDARLWAEHAREHWTNYIEALIKEGHLSPSA